ncbi:MAG TPA: transposase [Ktedonobacteraceae bacterium]
MSKQAYKFRLYPTRKQRDRLQQTLDACRILYNAALTERRDAYNFHVRQHPNYYDEATRRERGRELAINYYSQAHQLPAVKAIREEYHDIHAQVLQDVLRRVQKAFDAFFRRCKVGEEPGYPRFQGKGRYDSFTYPQAGFSLTHDSRVCLSKIGSIKVMLHRAIKGRIKTCTVKREANAWYVILTCEVESEPLPENNEAIGVDLGLLRFATFSTGETIENPRYLRKAEKKLERLQQSLSRKKHGSHRRRKVGKLVGKTHRKVAHQRRDFLHKASRKLVNAYGVLVFEELQPANMNKRPKPKQDEIGCYLPNGAAAKSGLNKSIADAGWGIFQQFCVYKAANAGRTVLFVNPKYTSQICSECGTVIKKELSERWHSCECGCSLDRDHNAALNILRLGRSL